MTAQLHSIFLRPEGREQVDDVPRPIAMNLESFRHHHAGFNHTLYGLEKGRAFIAAEFGKEVTDAFDDLVPLAYKADLLRYCLLYHYGGIYADLSLFFFAPLLGGHPTGMLHVFRDGFSAAPWITSNSLIGAARAEAVFVACIENILRNVSRREFGANELCPTGPNLFGRNLASVTPLDRIRCGETVALSRRPGVHAWAYVTAAGEVIAVNVKKGVGLGSLGAHQDNYNLQYSRRGIYRSQLGQPLFWGASDYRAKGFIRDVGRRSEGELREVKCVLYGPYVALERGSYRAQFALVSVETEGEGLGSCFLDVCAGGGRHTLCRSPPMPLEALRTPGALALDFQLDVETSDVEVRLFVDTWVSLVFESLVISRLADAPAGS